MEIGNRISNNSVFLRDEKFEITTNIKKKKRLQKAIFRNFRIFGVFKKNNHTFEKFCQSIKNPLSLNSKFGINTIEYFETMIHKVENSNFL